MTEASKSAHFPTTHWSRIIAAGDCSVPRPALGWRYVVGSNSQHPREHGIDASINQIGQRSVRILHFPGSLDKRQSIYLHHIVGTDQPSCMYPMHNNTRV